MLDDREREGLLVRLRLDAETIAAAFGLAYREISPARRDTRSFYGLCDRRGSIRIRLHHARTGRGLRYSSLINTLCHELAHLRHFNHGPEFVAFYRRILEWARREGLYRPSRAGAASSVESQDTTRMGGTDEDLPLTPGEVRACLAELRRRLESRGSASTSPAQRTAAPPAAPGPKAAPFPRAHSPAEPVPAQLSLFGDGS